MGGEASARELSILNEAILSISPSALDSANPSNNNEASSDNNLDMNDNMLDNLLKGITNADETINDTNGNHDDDQEGDTAKKQCENEFYQLLLGTEFKMKMKNVESKVYNYPLSW